MGLAPGCGTAVALLGPADHACCPQGGAPGWGLSLPNGGPVGLMTSPSPEHLLKLPLQGLYEFLQDKISGPWALEDDAVIKKLQASMAELHRKNWDLPPPGGLSRGLLLIPPPGP